MINFGVERSAGKYLFDKVCVIGLGYVGLPSAAIIANSGIKVHGVDVNPFIIDEVNAGRPHLVENGLPELIEKVVSSGQLTASLEPAPADAFIITVPTPVAPGADHAPDTSYVEAAARSIAKVLQPGNMVILESTSPVGTTAMITRLMAELRPDLVFPIDGNEEIADIDMAYSPERVIPGKTLEEIVTNDRVVGGVTPRAAQRAAGLYRYFIQGELLITNDRTAEMCKLVENTFRDVNIALANELSLICEDHGLDVWEVIRYANRHPRVNILSPGPGVGGHCIPVDPWFVVASSPERARLVRTAREINDNKPLHVVQQVSSILNQIPGATVACFGLTYKPDVDDFRESPAVQITAMLSDRFPGRVVGVDPYHEVFERQSHGEHHVTFANLEEGLKADVLVLLVGHQEFLGVDWDELADRKIVFDIIGLGNRTRKPVAQAKALVESLQLQGVNEESLSGEQTLQ
jgi:UDP-N-acetyl-D-mannosaminuronic acid dehydrogenase